MSKKQASAINRCAGAWFIDFHEVGTDVGPKGEPLAGKLIETKLLFRAYAPTRWARNHVLTLRRKHQGIDVTFHITVM